MTMMGDGIEMPVEAHASAPGRAQGRSMEADHAAKMRKSMDDLSLEQALKDVEIANARVIDLTQRLIAAQRRIIELQTSVDRVHVELSELRARHHQIVDSKAFRVADRYWRLLGALRQ